MITFIIFIIVIAIIIAIIWYISSGVTAPPPKCYDECRPNYRNEKRNEPVIIPVDRHNYLMPLVKFFLK